MIDRYSIGAVEDASVSPIMVPHEGASREYADSAILVLYLCVMMGTGALPQGRPGWTACWLDPTAASDAAPGPLPQCPHICNTSRTRIRTRAACL
jgi:hypothetical protein